MPSAAKYGHYILQIPTRDVVGEAEIPLHHMTYAASHALRMVDYFIGLKNQASVYTKGFERHRKGLASLAFLQIMAAFERFLKEIAAACVDELAGRCTDDRLKVFSVDGSAAFPHFQEQTVGRALCESTLWHGVDEINERFKKLLRLPSDPDNKNRFVLFDCQHNNSRNEVKVIRVAFQMRHTLAHNLGLVTPSDGSKLQRLLGEHRTSPAQLDIDRKHVYYLQRFLVPLCEEINLAVAKRLCLVLTEFHTQAPQLVDPHGDGQRLANLFQTSCTIANSTSTP